MPCCIISKNSPPLAANFAQGSSIALDRATSGLMVVAKNDDCPSPFAKQFSGREVHKTYLALVHGWPKQDRGTVQSAISRHSQRRTRMTTRGFGGRDAVTHYVVQRKIDSPYGKFALLEVKIETGRTHQIRVHMSSLGHPVVGDALYGAPGELRSQSNQRRAAGMPAILKLDRNFLHSAALELTHPRTKESLQCPGRYRRNWHICSIAWRMLGSLRQRRRREIGGLRPEPKIVGQKSYASLRSIIRELILMKLRIPLLLVAFALLAGSALRSASAQEPSPAKPDDASVLTARP